MARSELHCAPTSAVADEPPDAIGPERGGAVVERVDPHAERDVELELGAASHEREIAAGLRPATDLLEQPRLANPRLTLKGERDRRAAGVAPQRRLDGDQLAPPSDQLPFMRRQRRGVTQARLA